eukprot:2517122-Pleurochrysis_carterae.AAC.2
MAAVAAAAVVAACVRQEAGLRLQTAFQTLEPGYRTRFAARRTESAAVLAEPRLAKTTKSEWLAELHQKALRHTPLDEFRGTAVSHLAKPGAPSQLRRPSRRFLHDRLNRRRSLLAPPPAARGALARPVAAAPTCAAPARAHARAQLRHGHAPSLTRLRQKESMCAPRGWARVRMLNRERRECPKCRKNSDS